MQILDCTFRDGGYYTDWNFSNEVLNKYLNAVSKLPISIVELGYISNKRDQNGPFFHLDKTLLSKTKSKLRNNQKVFAMINFNRNLIKFKPINRSCPLRNNISLVTQETILFNDSIANNIKYGKLDASENEIERVARLSGILEFSNTLEQKLNTRGGHLRWLGNIKLLLSVKNFRT